LLIPGHFNQGVSVESCSNDLKMLPQQMTQTVNEYGVIIG
jgi:hypothetical protein